MKFNKLVILSVIVLYSCNEPKKVTEQQISEIKLSVDSLLTNWHQAASDADFDAYFDAIDSISIIIGTDATEYWSKEEFIDFAKPYFDKGEAWDFKTLERNVYLNRNADVAWFDELLDTWMGTCRGSGVLEKSCCGWKLKHYVFTIPIPNEVVDEVIEIKHVSDSAFLNKFRKEK